MKQKLQAHRGWTYEDLLACWRSGQIEYDQWERLKLQDEVFRAWLEKRGLS